MTLEQYLDALWSNWPKDGECPSAIALELMDAAIAAHPGCAELWRIVGNFYELEYIAGRRPRVDPLVCYRHAASLDPSDSRAWASIGFYLDAFLDDFSGAEAAFRCAMTPEAEPEVYWGLARVLAQQGRRDEALLLLSETKFPADSDIRKMQKEVTDGLWDPPSDCDHEP